MGGIMANLTVGDLKNYVDNQLCLHGNKKVFVLPEQPENQVFELYAGHDSIVECMNFDEACLGECGLIVIEERLSTMEDSLIISSSFGTPFKTGFQLGVRSAIDGFVELINSEELVKPTEVI